MVRPKRLIFLAIFVLPAVALLAFGPRGKVDIPRGRTLVRYWEKWTGVEGQAMRSIVDRFNTGPGRDLNIWVDYNAISAIEQRTLVAIASGDPPDIAGLYDFIVPQYADRGALAPLDAAVRELDIRVDELNPVWLDVCRYEDQLYALPSTPYIIALYYNRALFRQADLDPDHPPRSITEMTDAVAKLTRRNDHGRIVQAGFTLSPAMLGWWPWIWPSFFDGELWNGRDATIDTPAGHAALGWLAQMRRAPDLSDAQSFDDWTAFEATAGAIESAQNPFLSGRVAMVFQGPWMSNWIREYAPELDYAVAAFPTQDGRGAVLASTDVFVIPRGARQVRAALLFLAYVQRQEVMEELCRLHNKISPFRAPSDEFLRRHPNPFIRTFEELSHSARAIRYPKMPTWPQVRDEVLQMLNSALRDPARAEQTLAPTQAKVQSILNEYEQIHARRAGKP